MGYIVLGNRNFLGQNQYTQIQKGIRKQMGLQMSSGSLLETFGWVDWD